MTHHSDYASIAPSLYYLLLNYLHLSVLTHSASSFDDVIAHVLPYNAQSSLRIQQGELVLRVWNFLHKHCRRRRERHVFKTKNNPTTTSI